MPEKTIYPRYKRFENCPKLFLDSDIVKERGLVLSLPKKDLSKNDGTVIDGFSLVSVDEYYSKFDLASFKLQSLLDAGVDLKTINVDLNGLSMLDNVSDLGGRLVNMYDHSVKAESAEAEVQNSEKVEKVES